MRLLLTAIVTSSLATAGAAVVGAPQPTARPGEMTEGRVWIQNRPSEPVPVDIRNVDASGALRVAIANGENSAGAPGPLRVRLVTPVWEYRTVAIKSADDVGGALSELGRQGWEATGATLAGADGPTLLLKRAR